MTACCTRKCLRINIASQANQHVEFVFGRRNRDGFCVAWGLSKQRDIFDNVSLQKAIRVPIVLYVCFYLISVSKLWDMIIHLCMFKGRMGHANIPDSKSHWLITNELDIVLPVTMKSDTITKFGKKLTTKM